MSIIYITIIILFIGTMGIVFNKKFLLSLLITLEFLLLKTIIFNIYIGVVADNFVYTHLSIFILALSAVEARIGISLISLLSRNLQEVTLKNLKTLNN